MRKIAVERCTVLNVENDGLIVGNEPGICEGTAFENRQPGIYSKVDSSTMFN